MKLSITGVVMNTHIDLAKEFPEFADKIHDKKMSDAHFKRLHEQYTELNQAVYRAETRIDLVSEEEEEKMRKERLILKDELYGILTESE
jgi:uncharacterized protein YdcH (DUF465 family)